jgi:hypothetical protein
MPTIEEKYRIAFEALTQIAGGSTNPQGVARDAVDACINLGQTSPRCAYCGGDGIIPGPLMEVYNCPVCRPTTTTTSAHGARPL